MKLTPLYNVHLSLGAKMFTTASGYQMPAYYGKVEDEHRAVRENVGMIDLSLMGRIDVKGKQAQELVQVLSVNDAGKLADGQVMYTTFCSENGNIVDDVTVWRFGPTHFRVVTSSVMRQRSLKWIMRNVSNETDAYVSDVSSSLGCIAVQGPRSRQVLQKICERDLAQLRFFRFVFTKLSGIPAIVARVGFTGELGFECYVGTEETVQAWDSIRSAGKEHGIVPYGLDVLDALRFEKGFIFFGYEVTKKNNPFECGLEKWINFNKPRFLGKQALLSIRTKGPEKKLVGLQVAGDETLQSSQEVRFDGQRIGEVLFGFRALTLGRNMAWAFVGTRNAEFGRKVTVVTESAEKDAVVVDPRCYDPSGERMKA